MNTLSSGTQQKAYKKMGGREIIIKESVADSIAEKFADGV